MLLFSNTGYCANDCVFATAHPASHVDMAALDFPFFSGGCQSPITSPEKWKNMEIYAHDLNII